MLIAFVGFRCVCMILCAFWFKYCVFDIKGVFLSISDKNIGFVIFDQEIKMCMQQSVFYGFQTNG